VSPQTEVIRASELRERVIERILNLRHPEVFPNYRKELATYKRRLRGHKEVAVTKGDIFSKTKHFGFLVTHLGQEIFVARPSRPRPCAWAYSSYDRHSFLGQTTSYPSKQYGLLADPLYNREIRKQRLDEYEAAMRAGEWRDLLSDPIALTEDGHVLNGQHRLAAASRVDWNEVENDPAFLVVWGADPGEALYADGSRRTALDEKTIAVKLVHTPTDGAT
jgi:hypothetical protein